MREGKQTKQLLESIVFWANDILETAGYYEMSEGERSESAEIRDEFIDSIMHPMSWEHLTGRMRELLKLWEDANRVEGDGDWDENR